MNIKLLAFACLISPCLATIEFDEEFYAEVESGWEDNWEEVYGDILPEEPIPEELENNLTLVNYFLWTESYPVQPFVLEPFDETNLEISTFDFSLPTYVLYHGYDNHGLTGYIIDMKNALLTKENCNVISVDYGDLAQGPYYVRAVRNMYQVAHQAASILDWMVQDFGLDVKALHIIGHSLGAHNAGMTGQFLRNGAAARVTGLDPAGPLFYSQSPNYTISQTSADFVDIIHTNGCFLLDGCYGIFRELGHVDFYPNGGVHQTGCMNDTMDPMEDLEANCSHHRSVLFWIESILATEPQNKTFKSWPCSSWESFDAGNCTSCGSGCQEMGFPASAEHPGYYFLRTSEDAPYALGTAGSLFQPSAVAAMTILATLTSLCQLR